MKLTLSDCMQRINQILNYPSVSYEDISHFFDQAISELNTILKIAIPSVSEMVSNNTFDPAVQENTVLLNARPTSSIATVTVVPTEDPVDGPSVVFYKNPADSSDRGFYAWDGVSWNSFKSLYGVYFENASKTTYQTVVIGPVAHWVEVPDKHTVTFDLCTYMTFDWWILFVIPYVCFKFAVRNGDNGALYSEEFAQGLQQLQTCYDVPNFVELSTVAGHPVYTEIVKQNLSNLTKKIPTMAITENMRVGNAISAVFGNMFDNGGWGV